MTVRISVACERADGEKRVALDPVVATKLAALGARVQMEHGAGLEARFPDAAYEGVSFFDRDALLVATDLLLTVAPPGVGDVERLPEGATVIGFFHAHRNPALVQALNARRITSFAMELVPRISRAQSMDALSSQAAVAGYKAAIMGADLACRFFPMLTTAAGTIRPSKVIVLGAGVAGLQAIATARRLGAVVEAYDVRSATKEQVESLGAKFLDLGVSAEGEGGYARELTADERERQQEALAGFIAKADVLITTAAIPGRPSPKLVPESMVRGMKPGAVIIDLAAEGGGNCELTRAGETVVAHDVVIHGPLNVPSQVALHASEMYAKNLLNFLQPWIKDGELVFDFDDEVVAKSCLTRDGETVHGPTREQIGSTAASA
ncbi:MAG: NAD(P) transhydrogenase subunit alpha [Thioalkalivibrionaceae bacterium]